MKPDALMLIDEQGAYTRGAVAAEVEGFQRRLRGLRPQVLALDLDNGIGWAVADLAAMCADVPLLPLPRFFSPAQCAHAIRDAGADWLLSTGVETAVNFPEAVLHERVAIAGASYALWYLNTAPRPLPPGTAKITYTSGTTGEPKGVCLGIDAMMQVAASLAEACELNADDTHVSALPLATLLENIGSLYAQGLAGARSVLLPTQQVGLQGMESFDAEKLLHVLRHYGATNTILVPQMLAALVLAVESGSALPAHLRFVAVGGAVLAPALLERARNCGLPVYQGYGLSECASVVALNKTGADRVGSVGRVLPHAQVSIDSSGEIFVSGAALLGYTGLAQRVLAPVPTGDIGRLDEDGYLYIEGRRRDMLISSYGRNISPEWIENELLAEEGILQAAVFGEARPWLSAVIVARSAADIAPAVARANARLPEYAQVRAWIPADHPFSPANLQATANGRLRRETILAYYRERLNALYEKEDAHVEV